MHRPFDLGAVRARLASVPCPSDSPEPGARAAVAAVLRQPAAGEGAELLFIRRAEHPLDPWSGHMAFPGGRRDPGDPDLLHTAVRETLEEVGLDLRTHGTVLTRLPDLPAVARGHRVGIVIVPYVFALERPEVSLVHNHEVAETLWVPLASLARGEGAGTIEWARDGERLELPCIRVGERPIWGLTYRMLEVLLETLARSPG